jgi:membrane protein YqaA with SNARE-associated domain
VFSVLGGVAGYVIGVLGFEMIEPWLRESPRLWSAYEESRDWLARNGVWVIFLAGFSPLPYKVSTIAAGVAALNLPLFIIASVIGRGARFYLVAGLIVWGGDRLEDTLQKYVERIGWAVVLVVLLAVAWFVVRG